MQISRTKFLGLYALMCMIWGSTWLVIHIGMDGGLPPFAGAAIRFGLASIGLWIWVWGKHIPLPKTSVERRSVFIVGFLSNGISFAIVYWTAQYVPSGLAAIIFGTMPLWTAVFAHLTLPNDQLSAGKLTGILIGIGGIAVIFIPQIETGSTVNIGAMILLCASPIVSAISAVITKKYTHEVHPVMLNAVSSMIGFIVLALLSLLREDIQTIHLNGTHIWTTLYLAVLGTIVSFVTYFRLIKMTSPVTMSYISLITPVIAVVLGWLILSESLGMNDLLGAVCILTGVLLSLRSA